MNPMHFGFSKFIPDLFRKKPQTFFNYVFEQFKFVAQNSATMVPPTMFTLALPWPYMNHRPVEMTTQPLVCEGTVWRNQRSLFG